MNGGLGNQVFQFIFARYLEETKGSRVLIDDMHFFVNEDEINYNKENTPLNTPEKTSHNGYEIEYVFPNIEKPMLLSEYFDLEVWQYMVQETKISPLQRLGVVRQLLANEMDISVLIEAGDLGELDGLTCPKYITPANQFNSAVARFQTNMYYYGYWINPGWFNRYRDIFLKEMAFRPITDSKNKQYERDIRRSFAVGVHIRRGDFVRLNWALDENYYHDVLSDVKAQLVEAKLKATFFVFSDDLEWCKNNAEQLGLPAKSTIYVEGNYDYKNNYIDVHLMSLCDVLVESNSSFCYLASMVSQTPGFQTIQVREPPLEDVAGGIQKLVL